MINRYERIKSKGFAMSSDLDKGPVDYSKIKVGLKTLEDATVNLTGDFKRANNSLGNKENILQYINDYKTKELKEASDFYYRASGIYQRLCRYAAYLYRYDWFVTPYFNTSEAGKNVEKKMNEVLRFFDNSQLKKFFGEAALKVMRHGSFYGYKIPSKNKIKIQELPCEYCRSRFSVDGKPAIEFNMKYFKDAFSNDEYIEKILKLFPEEFTKGYHAYKEGKLVADMPGDKAGWYLLDVKNTVKFNLHDEDIPAFTTVIPAIIDLDQAKALDRKKMEQQLLKIIIQKMPFDKNGDLIFDVDEAKDLHNNAVRMLGKAIGIDVLTTFAEVDVADMSDRGTVSAKDELERVERGVYNESGTAQNLFNTDGSTALEKSILNDEASIYTLILQFESFLNEYLEAMFNKNNLSFRVQILPTTVYNYKDLAKIYKEQTSLGYTRMLPQIAMGQSQSSIIANARYENEILDVSSFFIPPMSSNTMSGKDLQNNKKEKQGGEEKQNGRPEKPEDEKSEKTLQNLESIG